MAEPRGMLKVDASATGGGDFATFMSNYFAGLAEDDYKFYGGTPDSAFGQTYYMNGDQVAFQYKEGETVTTDRLLFGGDDLAYDFIHYGAGFGHGLSGSLDSWTFGQWTDETSGEQGTGEAGLITGLLEQLKITGFDIDVAPGSGNVGNLLNMLFGMAAAGDAAGLMAFMGEYAQHFVGSNEADAFAGTKFGDIVALSGGDDTSNGAGGDDTMKGGNGDDLLKGGKGDDLLVGGRGDDRLNGGAGEDTFDFSVPLAKAGVDKIVDFGVGEDTVQLSSKVFAGLGLGELSADAFATKGAETDTTRIVYDADRGILLYDADGAGGEAAVKFATIGKHLDLSHLDFLVA
jgi:Ca2+-binding RTX toxin-like protein